MAKNKTKPPELALEIKRVLGEESLKCQKAEAQKMFLSAVSRESILLSESKAYRAATQAQTTSLSFKKHLITAKSGSGMFSLLLFFPEICDGHFLSPL